MSFSKTEICNLALGRIGALSIASIDGTDKNSRACENAFELVVREVSRNGSWNCLKKRVELAKLTSVPAFGFDYAYQLPNDCISVVQLNGWDGSQQDIFDIEGRTLVTDADVAQIQYVAYVDNPYQWDSLFTSAVVALLASRIAIYIRQDEGLSGALMQEYERIIAPKAQAKNFNEKKRGTMDIISGSRFIASRYNSTNG